MKTSKSNKMDAAKRLEKLREAMGFTQREMAAELGVVHGAVGLWEAGKRRIPGPVLKLIDLYEEELGIKQIDSHEPALDSLKTGWLSRTVRLTGCGTQILGKVVLDALFRMMKPDDDEGSLRRKTQGSIAMRIAETFGELKGLPHKVGQLMSYMDMDSPDEIRAIYADLQYLTPPIRASVVSEVIVEEFGKTPNQLFKEWDNRPFAAASIGQLHRATTHDGKVVAVKVQYPGIKNVIKSDLQSASLLDRLGSMLIRGQEQNALLEEMTERFLGECDYIKEAANQTEMRRVSAGDKEVIVPKVIPELSSSRVITMEYFDSQRYGDFIRKATQSQKDKAGYIIWKHAFTSIFKHKIFNADPHPGNYLFDENAVVFLDFGCVKHISPEFFKHWKRFIRSVIEDDIDEMKEAINDLGIVTNREKFNYDRFFNLMRNWYYPCYTKKEFQFTKEFVAKQWKEMKSWNVRKMHMRFPKELLFLNQLQWGLYAVLADMKAKANWSKDFLPLLKLER